MFHSFQNKCELKQASSESLLLLLFDILNVLVLAAAERNSVAASQWSLFCFSRKMHIQGFWVKGNGSHQEVSAEMNSAGIGKKSIHIKK